MIHQALLLTHHGCLLLSVVTIGVTSSTVTVVDKSGWWQEHLRTHGSISISGMHAHVDKWNACIPLIQISRYAYVCMYIYIYIYIYISSRLVARTPAQHTDINFHIFFAEDSNFSLIMSVCHERYAFHFSRYAGMLMYACMYVCMIKPVGGKNTCAHTDQFRSVECMRM